MPPKQERDHSTSAETKTKKATKEADASPPASVAASANEEGQETQEAPEALTKRVRKPQLYDKRGLPHYVELSDDARQARQAAMLALGLKQVGLGSIICTKQDHNL